MSQEFHKRVMCQKFLTLIEKGFTNLDLEVKLSAYRTWTVLIDNFALDTGSCRCVESVDADANMCYKIYMIQTRDCCVLDQLKLGRGNVILDITVNVDSKIC